MSARGPRVRAIGVADDIYPDMPGQYAALASGAARLHGAEVEIAPADLWLDMDFLGGGYAVPTPEAVAAIRLLARTEGILCGPVYSGKALAALAEGARAGAPEGPTVFWHTGGYHALFAPRFAAAVLAGASATDRPRGYIGGHAPRHARHRPRPADAVRP